MEQDWRRWQEPHEREDAPRDALERIARGQAAPLFPTALSIRLALERSHPD